MPSIDHQYQWTRAVKIDSGQRSIASIRKGDAIPRISDLRIYVIKIRKAQQSISRIYCLPIPGGLRNTPNQAEEGQQELLSLLSAQLPSSTVRQVLKVPLVETDNGQQPLRKIGLAINAQRPEVAGVPSTAEQH